MPDRPLSALVAPKGVFARQLRKLPCTYCGTRRGGTVDYLRPIFRGGTWTRGNLVPACRRCNLFKGSQTLTELALVRPDLALHALWTSPLARMEWVRLTAPVELVTRFDRAVGYAPLPPIQSVPLPSHYPRGRGALRPARLPSARRAFTSLSPDAWFAVPDACRTSSARAA
ncbi:HNH endonuclease [Mycobacteroides abscessus]|uniref:HNH endonuclease n=1 Tax=Mycobacteroides abscessus TaxID=36809 RepID=UPI000C256540